jgi:hypothetical protein
VSVGNVYGRERFADKQSWAAEFEEDGRKFRSLHYAMSAVGTSLRAVTWPYIERVHRSPVVFQNLLDCVEDGFVGSDFIEQLELAFVEFDRKADVKWIREAERYILAPRWFAVAKEIAANLQDIPGAHEEAFQCVTNALANAFVRNELKTYRADPFGLDTQHPVISAEAWYGRAAKQMQFARGMIGAADQDDAVGAIYDIMVDATELDRTIDSGVWLVGNSLSERIAHEIRKIDQLWATGKNPPPGTAKEPDLRKYILNHYPDGGEIYDEIWRRLSASRELKHFAQAGRRPVIKKPTPLRKKTAGRRKS